MEENKELKEAITKIIEMSKQIDNLQRTIDQKNFALNIAIFFIDSLHKKTETGTILKEYLNLK